MSVALRSTTRPTPPKLPRPYPAPVVDSPVIEGLRHRLAGIVPEKSGAVVAEFWRRHDRRPILSPVEDGSVIVTFCWRDARAREVLLFVNRMTDERALADSLMRHLDGTDLWWLAYRMDADWRASYAFLPRYPGEDAPWLTGDQVRIRQVLDRGRPDPANPTTCRNRAGVVQSVVELPAAPPQPWLAARPDSVRGDVEVVTAHLAPGGRRLWIHRPAGLTTRSPVLLALDGDVWNGAPGESTQDLPTMLANLVADGELPPMLTIMIDSGSRDERWRELDPSGEIGSSLADDLMPWIRARYGVEAASHDVVVVGQSLGGLVALGIGIARPDVIGCVLSQSASLWQNDLRSVLVDRRLAGSRFHLQVGRQEWVLRRPNLALARNLRAHGGEVSVRVHNGGHDYAWWRGGLADGLRVFFGGADG